MPSRTPIQRCCGLVLLLLAHGASAATALDIDGRLDDAAWRDARVIDDFRLTEPRTREPAPWATQALLLATPEGLAIGFRCSQPADLPRTRERTPRDQAAAVDRVAVTVDYEGTGRTALAFTVTLSDGILDGTVVNENQYSTDWDGNWQHAVTEDDAGWSVEFLLPWHLAPMAAAQDGQRTLRIGLSRVLGASGERVSWPAVHLTEQRFVSLLEPVSLPAYSMSLLALTPYVVASADLAGHRRSGSAGLDLFWKPSDQFQLAATLNPDFGQVESDQLVVNFSAVETFFSDRRPFFTENQSLFDVPFGIANSRMLYTRRVGGSADDGEGASDVGAALKLNGSRGALQYGLFAADEHDSAGRRFLAARSVLDLGAHDLGLMLTDVERPFLDRRARTFALDHRWAQGDDIGLRTTAVGSDITQDGDGESSLGFQTRLDQRFNERFRHQLYFLHMGDALDLNDFGYLDRNDLDYLRYEVGDRRTQFAEGSHYTSIDHRYATSTRRNNRGMKLFDAAAWYRNATLDDGSIEYSEITLLSAANDDRILRGNGVARLPARYIAYYERFRPRKGNWALDINAASQNEGLGGFGSGGLTLSGSATYYFSDALNLTPTLSLRWSPDWVLWRGANRLATFEARQVSFNTDFNWIVSPRSELRLKLETIALRADAIQGYRVGADRQPRASDDDTPDFSLGNLGFQLRYRYQLAPLSDLYVVYSRGGFGFDEGPRDLGGLFSDTFTLDDDEQFLVKLSYRFEV